MLHIDDNKIYQYFIQQIGKRIKKKWEFYLHNCFFFTFFPLFLLQKKYLLI